MKACRLFFLVALVSLFSASHLASQADCQTICQEGNTIYPTYFCIVAAYPNDCTYCTVTCPSGGGGGQVLVQH